MPFTKIYLVVVGILQSIRVLLDVRLKEWQHSAYFLLKAPFSPSSFRLFDLAYPGTAACLAI